jgi:UDP-N-acetyl-D-glucosamine dehydrogenase
VPATSIPTTSDLTSPHSAPPNAHALDELIRTRTAIYGIIGLGYVGLPLGVVFADAGFRVLGFDVNQPRVDSLNAGMSYVPDVPEAIV